MVLLYNCLKMWQCQICDPIPTLGVVPDSSVGIAIRYGLDGPGIESGLGRDFPDRPWAHPASCTMGAGPFPGVKRPERGVDHSSRLAPRLMKE